MLSFIWSLIIGGGIGAIAGYIVGRDMPFGIIGNILCGIGGSWLGSQFLGHWGPEIGGFYIIPALIGAVVLILIFSFIFSMYRKGQRKSTRKKK